MKAFFQNLRRGFSNLLRFDGRDSRAQFWPYAGLVVLAVTHRVIGFVLAMIIVIGGEALHEPEPLPDLEPTSVTVETTYLGVGDRSTLTIEDGSGFAMPWFLIGNLVLAALCSAAVTRRLHDHGRSGWWALAPLLIASTLETALWNPWIHLRPYSFLVGWTLYLVSLLGLAIYLAVPGQRGANQFGADPREPKPQALF